MNQSDAETIGTALADAGFDFIATLPADQLHALQSWVHKSQRFTSVAVTNEGEGVAICAGAWLAGKMPAIILETSGILLSTYALMRCHATFGIPILMLSTYRGGLGDQEWYAASTGAVLPQLLERLAHPLQGRGERRRGGHDLCRCPPHHELVAAPGLDRHGRAPDYTRIGHRALVYRG